MPISARTLPPATNGSNETVLEFPDNRLLMLLCGEHDRYLAQIEARLSVQITHRGNELIILGASDDRARTAALLEALHARVAAGHEIDAGVIDSEIRMGAGASQASMFPGSRFELHTRRKRVEPRSEAQQHYVENLFLHELAFGIGPAGTGKTYLAVAVAVTKFLAGEVERIILSRPAVEAGERLGFLPGDMREKIDPFMQPLYDALNDFLPGKLLQKLMEDGRIEIAPLAYMRGRTLSNAFVVLDEAQNATAMQMKMFLTRLGQGSRMVITGDRSQVDLPKGTASGIIEAERLLAGVEGISFNYFTARDVVRHPLVARIIEAYAAGGA